MDQSVLATTVDLRINLDKLPACKCGQGVMVPMQDEARGGAIYIKGWICTACYHNVALKNGELYIMAMPSDQTKSL